MMVLCHKKNKILLKLKLNRNSCKKKISYQLERILLVKVVIIIINLRKVCELNLV